jgi:hypothetical protein
MAGLKSNKKKTRRSDANVLTYDWLTIVIFNNHMITDQLYSVSALKKKNFTRFQVELQTSSFVEIQLYRGKYMQNTMEM